MLVSGSDLPAWIQNFVLSFAENGVDFVESSVFGHLYDVPWLVLALTQRITHLLIRGLKKCSTIMNILHTVTKQQEVPAKLKKLQGVCKSEGQCAVQLEKEELRKQLSPMQFRVTQEKGTESAYSGKFVNWKDEGVYNCVVCGNSIFASETKFDSKSGWPAFHDVINKDRVILSVDTTHGIQRMEVKCGDCRAHLGHVFDDGPKPTGIRYCVNSCALDFKKHTTV